MEGILDGIQRFRDDVYPGRRAEFEALAAGQKPQLLLITCSDSRIDPALITQTDPGDVFVLRNAGNLVPAAGAPAGAEAATIEFAIRGLGIPHIAVCGHSHCGAMAALGNPSVTEELPALRGWLAHARESREYLGDLEAIEDPALRQVAANVLTQLDHLRTHPAVGEALGRGDLVLHGWVYDIAGGEILEVVPSEGLRPVQKEAARASA